MKQIKSLSIVFPAYNDEHSIGKLITDAYSVGATITNSFEVIVVNDGSKDGTNKKLLAIKKKFPSLKIVTHKNNRGYGGALQSGFKKAVKDWIFYTDGDGQYDLKDLPKLVRSVGLNIDVVNGFKKIRRDSFIRIAAGNMYNRVLQLFFNLPISDVDCDFRLIRRKCLGNIRLKATTGVFPLELVLKLKKSGARFKEVSVNHYARPHGRSQFFRFSVLVATTIGFVILLIQILLDIL